MQSGTFCRLSTFYINLVVIFSADKYLTILQIWGARFHINYIASSPQRRLIDGIDSLGFSTNFMGLYLCLKKDCNLSIVDDDPIGMFFIWFYFWCENKRCA